MRRAIALMLARRLAARAENTTAHDPNRPTPGATEKGGSGAAPAVLIGLGIGAVLVLILVAGAIAKGADEAASGR